MVRLSVLRSLAFLSLCFITGAASTRIRAQDTTRVDLLDYLSARVPPDESERPENLSLQLPGTLQDLVAKTNDSSTKSDLSDWLRWLLLKNLPPTYEDNRKWGLQKSVYDGFRFRREGIKIETERKYKTVNDGTWSRYYLQFVEPEKRLKLEVHDFVTEADRFRFRLIVEAPLKAFGRVSRWQRDIQLISLSCNADVVVRLTVLAEVGVQANPLVFPPEFRLNPRATRAGVELIHFDVERISQLHGPLAEELGKGLRGLVDDRLKDFEEKLPDKINRELDKQKDKLQISLGSGLPAWLTQFSDSAAQK